MTEASKRQRNEALRQFIGLLFLVLPIAVMPRLLMVLGGSLSGPGIMKALAVIGKFFGGGVMRALMVLMGVPVTTGATGYYVTKGVQASWDERRQQWNSN